MTDIKSMNLAEMTAYFKELGEPAFRARQVFQWLHRGVSSFDEMTNLSKALREKLAAACVLCPPREECFDRWDRMPSAPAGICASLPPTISPTGSCLPWTWCAPCASAWWI